MGGLSVCVLTEVGYVGTAVFGTSTSASFSSPEVAAWCCACLSFNVNSCVCICVCLCMCVSLYFSQVAPPVSGVCLRYIAAQGPLPQTFTHFWQTVWEQQAHTVIMLTTLTERGRVYILLYF